MPIWKLSETPTSRLTGMLQFGTRGESVFETSIRTGIPTSTIPRESVSG
jgi:hypothetical protein